MKKLVLGASALMLCLLSGCSEATTVSHNIQEEAEKFHILRRIVFINNITGEYLFEARGNCSVETNNNSGRLEVTCKTGEDDYMQHFFGLSDNTSYVVEQLEWVETEKYKYELTFRPESIVPISIKTE